VVEPDRAGTALEGALVSIPYARTHGALVARVIELCKEQGGGIRNEAKYRRHLAGQPAEALMERIADLEADEARRHTAPREPRQVEFWTGGGRLNKVYADA